MNYLTLAISFFATIGTAINAWALVKYSKINVINGLQQLMLTKANFCNSLWDEAYKAATHPQIDIRTACAKTITEIIISIQLLDNSLTEYTEKRKRKFLSNQFWIELDTSLREFIKNSNPGEFEGVLRNQILVVKGMFGPFFKDY